MLHSLGNHLYTCTSKLPSKTLANPNTTNKIHKFSTTKSYCHMSLLFSWRRTAIPVHSVAESEPPL